MSETKNFKSKEGYKKFLAYEHMHLGPSPSPSKVKIAGKPHEVEHAKKQMAMKNRAEKAQA